MADVHGIPDEGSRQDKASRMFPHRPPGSGQHWHIQLRRRVPLSASACSRSIKNRVRKRTGLRFFWMIVVRA